jgi:hypothetical protein
LPPRPKTSVFEAFWPNGQRPRRNGQAAPAPVVTPTAAPTEAAPPPAPVEARGGEPAPQVHSAPVAIHQPAANEQSPSAEMAAPISVLKSGVVEGMAYTLYSDGSIEAQLPQGRLRFGSITELRNHIESDS